MDEWRCAECGGSIGVYEPLVVMREEGSLLTSRAAQPQLPYVEGSALHRTCHEGLAERQGSVPAHAIRGA